MIAGTAASRPGAFENAGLGHGVTHARGRCVPKNQLQQLIALVPAIRAPTVSPLFGTDWFAVESVIAEAPIRWELCLAIMQA